MKAAPASGMCAVLCEASSPSSSDFDKKEPISGSALLGVISCSSFGVVRGDFVDEEEEEEEEVEEVGEGEVDEETDRDERVRRREAFQMSIRI